ncbi:hypothetical protein Br6_02713 [Rhodococcus sp. Br-6]|uniref:hypothetical protein n=1 Tax=Rhodococcus hoagii TaxID=43767 RepID=UPI0008569B86|nr:hypothetical protein [Prescottella equi]WJJ13973.1 hypothetical protein P9990_12020 [Prescottella equi]GBF15330.1 hypothetical protein Br6_02713 [Rhodococcus sp. Br-6]
MESPTGERGRSLVSGIASRPTPCWVFGVVTGYYASERMSWESGETYWENALKWMNLPFFAVLTVVFLLAEVAYGNWRFLTLRVLAPAPFIMIQLRFALFLLYYPAYWLFWLGTTSAAALTIAAVILGQPRKA